jgi:hypothetical protein
MLVFLVPGVRNQPHLYLWPVPVRQRTTRRSEALPTSKQYTHFLVGVKPHSTNFHAPVTLSLCISTPSVDIGLLLKRALFDVPSNP